MRRNDLHLCAPAAPLSLPRSMARWRRGFRAARRRSAALPFWVVLRYGMHVTDGVRVSMSGQLRVSRSYNLIRQTVRLEIGAFRHRGPYLVALQAFSLRLQYLLLLLAQVTKFETDQPNHRVGQGDEQDYQQHRDEDRHRPPIYPLHLKRAQLDALDHHEMGDQVDQHHNYQKAHPRQRDQSLHT